MKSYCKGYTVGEAEVWAAYADWASHESGRKNAWRVAAEYSSPGAMVREIVSEVRERRLSFRPMRRYRKAEGGSGKVRDLTIESVKQQVCDYVVVRALGPMLHDRLGFWQLGGPHVRRASDLARACKRWMRTSSWWVHLDVRKCYQSMSTRTLRRMLDRYVRSPDVLYVADRLLSMHGPDLALGSYLSLRLCQLVLSFGYHEVEHMGKRRRGRWVPLVAHQCWWADDVWLMGTRKRDVQAAARALGRYLLAEFGLTLHAWQVCRVGDDEPMDVAGLVVRPGRVTLRADSFLRAGRALRRYRRRPSLARARTLVSHKGQWAATDSLGYRRRHGVDGTVRAAQRHISRLAGVVT